ncbi:MAG: hypothetical protein CVV24_10580 [Ignavibacteriae bacterium HGW-Ignavibacteriae-3]|nr:MAG: hypothetical protein CVV24_10580 [Ignavibacteriae bacterium HGW-Ignavibacteriae-3]
MKLAELQKKIADVLGVSASQKELSYEIFIDKISEILLDQITLKVPRIGFFQLKADAVDDGNQPLVFSPLSEDFVRDTRHLYLTLKVSPKIKTAPEPDSSVFSIGVGKPLLPLSIEDLPDTETSYALLKKSIEERVKELIMESDQIPNFNIWDDYYNSPEKYENGSQDESKTQLSDLTSDLAFSQEIIPDKIPDSILEVLDYNPDPDNTPRIDDVPDAGPPEIKQSGNLEYDDEYTIVGQEKFSFDGEEKYDYSGDEPDSDSPEDKNSDDEEDYSELEKMEYDDSADDRITISELLDDTLLPLISQKTEVSSGKDADLLPTNEVVNKILSDEKNEIPGKKKEDLTNIVNEKLSSVFEELHKIHDESQHSGSVEKAYGEKEAEKTSVDSELNSKEDDLERLEYQDENAVIDSDMSSEENIPDEEPDKIEWNWGDELREEFGIPTVAGEDVKFEPENSNDSEEKDNVEFVDEYFEDEQIKKDLFSQLEKTLEKEFHYEEPPKDRATRERGKSTLTLEKNNLKKVVLEFSGPPSKYEFIEDRPPEKEKRMAITLIDDSALKTRSTLFSTEEEINENEKSSYSRKMFIIFAGAVVLIAVIVALILFFENRSSQNSEQLNAAKRSDSNVASDSTPNEFAVQSQPAGNNSAIPGLDEFNEFPRTSESPVPIKDATDRQILETIKKEAAKLETSKKTEGIQSGNQNRSQTPPAVRSVAAETKISDRVFYDGKSYSLQISSWPTRSRADVEMNRLRGLGFNAVIVEANLPQKGGTWYRVRVGPFKSEQEANDFLRKNNF